MQKPAFIIGAVRSGAGKTTITLGILATLVKQGYNVQSFKCGPDFIDPTLHSLVTGNISYNLDVKMMGESCCRQTFEEHGEDADIIVVEGVMGLFDGAEASSAALAKILGLPTILVIDAQSSAESNAAVLHGFEQYDLEITIGGVIFNRIGSERHKELIDSAVRLKSSVEILGYLPREPEFEIPQRHLGLHMGDENPINQDALAKLVTCVEQRLDLDRMLGLSSRKMRSACSAHAGADRSNRKRLGFAKDEAFCFYYEQNLELLAQVGFEIVPFSPIHETHPPDNLDMLYFCGGYPELHAAQLAKNRTMHQGIRGYHNKGTPIYAECGGFMYLCRTLADENEVYSMVGIFPLNTSMNNRLRRLGYRVVSLAEDCILGPRGTTLYGHEFHYSDITDPVSSITEARDLKYLYRLDNNSHEGYSVGSAIGSYIHLHFGQSVDVLQNMFNILKS